MRNREEERRGGGHDEEVRGWWWWRGVVAGWQPPQPPTHAQQHHLLRPLLKYKSRHEMGFVAKKTKPLSHPHAERRHKMRSGASHTSTQTDTSSPPSTHTHTATRPLHVRPPRQVFSINSLFSSLSLPLTQKTASTKTPLREVNAFFSSTHMPYHFYHNHLHPLALCCHIYYTEIAIYVDPPPAITTLSKPSILHTDWITASWQQR